MEKLILDSIISITSQHDVDAIQKRLLEILASISSSFFAAIYTVKNITQDSSEHELTRIVSLTFVNNQDARLKLDRETIRPDKQFLQCIHDKSDVTNNYDGKFFKLTVPVLDGDKILNIIELKSEQDFSEILKNLSTLITIYTNCLITLIESETDKLTGLLNRRTFDRKLDFLLKMQKNGQNKYKESSNIKSKRNINSEFTAWLAIFDIDNFKKINDTYGHLFGDEVILLISQKMKRFFRNSDLLFRFGGEEFVIILEPIPDEMAYQTYNKFCNIISNHEFPQIGNVTISIGYARITETNFPQTILEHADEALYHAKETGKNCVHNYERLTEDGILIDKKSSGSTIFFD